MRIGIFGSYNKQSIGDKAILIGLLNTIFTLKSNCFVTVYSFDDEILSRELSRNHWYTNVKTVNVSIKKTHSNTESSLKGRHSTSRVGALLKNKLPKKLNFYINMLHYVKWFYMHRKKFELEKQDVFLVGGGNLLMDLFPKWPIRPYLFVKEVAKHNIPVFFIGVGALPVKTFLGRLIIKRMIMMANKILTRDEESAQFIESLAGRKAVVHPDLAFNLPFNRGIALRQNKQKKIVINVASIWSQKWPFQDRFKFDQYIKAHVNSLLQLYYEYNLKFVFILTNYTTDKLAADLIIKEITSKGVSCGNIEFYDYLMSVDEIINHLMDADCAVTTRLHAAIMALVMGCPAICLSYQPKVSGVLNSIGMEHISLNIEKVIQNHSLIGIEVASVLNDKKSYQINECKLNELRSKNLDILKGIIKKIQEPNSKNGVYYE